LHLVMMGFLILCNLCIAALMLGFNSCYGAPVELCSRHFHDKAAVDNSVNEAKALLASDISRVPIANRLVIMILFSRGFLSGGNQRSRLEYLRCSLLKLQQNLMVNTTADIFIWTLNASSVEQTMNIPDWLRSSQFSRTHVMTIPDSVWRVPCGLSDDSQWAARKHFDLDYYLMGRWRLTFSMDFAREMGYPYHLQFDDDAMLNGMLAYDIVQKLRNGSVQMGVFSDVIGEVAHLTLGLPELTRYWLKIRKYSPQGPLLRHMRPSDMNGLSSDGWDRLYHPGYFVIISLDFWFQPEVQDYLTTVMRSGRDIEGRWQEQAVQNMMRLVFIPEERLLVMNDVDIGHDRHKRENFQAWCVKTGLIAP